MNSDEDLHIYCKKLSIPLIGIYTKDELPKHKQQGAYIINLQDDNMGNGSHWCCFINEKGHFIYFDPFGLNAPSELQLWFGKKYIYNSKQIQSISTGYCGIYNIFFLKYMYQFKHLSINDRLKRFMALWSKNPSENLKRLKIYMNDTMEDGKFDNK